jgi:uncharacterized protein (TIGR00369 family)
MPRLVIKLTGLFHAGALFALADTTATAGALHVISPTGDVAPEQFPLTVQASINLLRNTNQGSVTAESHALHRGRTMIVMETEVRDAEGRLLLVVSTTHLVLGR